MNKKQQQLFISFFEEIYESEEAFEHIKKQIAQCPKSNLSQLFNLISLDQQQIHISRLREYLTDKIICNERELYELLEKIDLSRQGFINRDDFCRELTPLDEHIQNNKTIGEANTEVEGYFLELIMEYIKRYRILEVVRKELNFILPYNAFAQIDNFKTGLIGLVELSKFFNSNDFNISQYQLILLIHGLRRRCYLEVNLEVFCENLNPLQFGQYDAYSAQIEKEKLNDFLKRSRKEQDNMRRSRIQSRKIEHTTAKQQRRRKADLERELELENRINSQILQQQRKKQLLVRRAILEEDKDIRWNRESAHIILEEEKQRLLTQKLRNQELYLLKNEEVEINNVLARTALLRENDLEHSRRIKYQMDRDRQIQRGLELQRQSRRSESQYLREKSLREEMERQRESRLYQMRRKDQILDELFQRQRQSKRKQWMTEVQNSRRLYNQHLNFQKDRTQKQLEYEQIKNAQLFRNRPTDYVGNSRNTGDLERELEKTRLQMRERQTRLNFTESKRQPETAERSVIYRT